MARMNLVLDDELEKEFRDAVYRKLGMKKGNIQIAVEQALKEWIAEPKGKGREQVPKITR
jgi:hypothetical protein